MMAHAVVLHARCSNLSLRLLTALKERASGQLHDMAGPVVVSVAVRFTLSAFSERTRQSLGITSSEMRSALTWVYTGQHDGRYRHATIRAMLEENARNTILRTALLSRCVV